MERRGWVVVLIVVLSVLLVPQGEAIRPFAAGDGEYAWRGAGGHLENNLPGDTYLYTQILGVFNGLTNNGYRLDTHCFVGPNGNFGTYCDCAADCENDCVGKCFTGNHWDDLEMYRTFVFSTANYPKHITGQFRSDLAIRVYACGYNFNLATYSDTNCILTTNYIHNGDWETIGDGAGTDLVLEGGWNVVFISYLMDGDPSREKYFYFLGNENWIDDSNISAMNSDGPVSLGGTCGNGLNDEPGANGNPPNTSIDCQDPYCDGRQGVVNGVTGTCHVNEGFDVSLASNFPSCNDGFDNDGDIFIDMNDSDCFNIQGQGGTCPATNYGPIPSPLTPPGGVNGNIYPWFRQSAINGSDACCGDDSILFNDSFDNANFLTLWRPWPMTGFSFLEPQVVPSLGRHGSQGLLLPNDYDIHTGSYVLLNRTNTYVLKANIPHLIVFYARKDYVNSWENISIYGRSPSHPYVGDVLLGNTGYLTGEWVKYSFVVTTTEDKYLILYNTPNPGGAGILIDDVAITGKDLGYAQLVGLSNPTYKYFCSKDYNPTTAYPIIPYTLTPLTYWRWWDAAKSITINKVHTIIDTDFIANSVNWSYCAATGSLEYNANPVQNLHTFASITPTGLCQCPLPGGFRYIGGFTYNGITYPACSDQSEEDWWIAYFAANPDEDSAGVVGCIDPESTYTCNNPFDLDNCDYFDRSGDLITPPDDSGGQGGAPGDYADVPKGGVWGQSFWGDQGRLCDAMTGANGQYPGQAVHCNPGEYCLGENAYIINSAELSGTCCYSATGTPSCMAEPGLAGYPCTTITSIDGFRGELAPDVQTAVCRRGVIPSSDSVPGQVKCCLDGYYFITPEGFGTDGSSNFICYAENQRSLFAECCYGSNCQNGKIFTVDPFGAENFDRGHLVSGSQLHTIRSFDDYNSSNGVTTDYVRIYHASGTGDKQVGIFLETNWSKYDALEFDFRYDGSINEDQFTLSLINHGSQVGNTVQFLNYVTSPHQAGKFNHIIIPLKDISTANGRTNNIGIITPDSDTDIWIHYNVTSYNTELPVDNFILRSYNSELDRRYCSGPFRSWIPTLTLPSGTNHVDLNNFAVWGPVMYACANQLSFGWTGTKCCGSRASAPVGNLMQNSNFEAGITGWNSAGVDTRVLSNADLAWTGITCRSGTNCAIIMNDHDSMQERSHYLLPGVTYNISIPTHDVFDNGGTAHVYVMGNGGHNTWVTGFTIPTSSDWTMHSIIFNVPSSGTLKGGYLTIFNVPGSGQGAFLIDDVTVEPVLTHEYYGDTLGGCFDNTFIPDNMPVNIPTQQGQYKDILYYDQQFHGCLRSETFGMPAEPGLGMTLNQSLMCGVVGSYFCTFDENTPANPSDYFWSNANTGTLTRQVNATQRTDRRDAVNIIYNGNFEDNTNGWSLAGATFLQTGGLDGSAGVRLPITSSLQTTYVLNGSHVLSFFAKTIGPSSSFVEVQIGSGVYRLVRVNDSTWRRYVVPFSTLIPGQLRLVTDEENSGVLLDNIQVEPANILNQTTAFTAFAVTSSCCPSDMCWDGSTCVVAQEGLNMSSWHVDESLSGSFADRVNQYACTFMGTADWQYVYYKQAPTMNDSDAGYCYQSNMCWNGSTCVSPWTYTGCRTCQADGTWGSCDKKAINTLLYSNFTNDISNISSVWQIHPDYPALQITGGVLTIAKTFIDKYQALTYWNGGSTDPDDALVRPNTEYVLSARVRATNFLGPASLSIACEANGEANHFIPLMGSDNVIAATPTYVMKYYYFRTDGVAVSCRPYLYLDNTTRGTLVIDYIQLEPLLSTTRNFTAHNPISTSIAAVFCPSSQCWDGGVCVNGLGSGSIQLRTSPDADAYLSGSAVDRFDQYVCKNNSDDTAANWTPYYYKKNRDNEVYGFCADKNSCWNNNACVSSGTAFGDYVCTAGLWLQCTDETFGIKLDTDADGVVDYWCLDLGGFSEGREWNALSWIPAANIPTYTGPFGGWDSVQRSCQWLTADNMLLNGDFSSSAGWYVNVVNVDQDATFRQNGEYIYQRTFVVPNQTYTLSFDLSFANPDSPTDPFNGGDGAEDLGGGGITGSAITGLAVDETPVDIPQSPVDPLQPVDLPLDDPALSGLIRADIMFYNNLNQIITSITVEGTCNYNYAQNVYFMETNRSSNCTFKTPSQAASVKVLFTATDTSTATIILDDARLELGRKARPNYVAENACGNTSQGCWSNRESELIFNNSGIITDYAVFSQCCGDDGTTDDWNIYHDGSVGRCKHGLWEHGPYPMPDGYSPECARPDCASGSDCSPLPNNTNYFCDLTVVYNRSDGINVYFSRNEPIFILDTDNFGNCDDGSSLRRYELNEHPSDFATVVVYRRDYNNNDAITDLTRSLEPLTTGNCANNQYYVNEVDDSVLVTGMGNTQYSYGVRYTTMTYSANVGVKNMTGVCRSGVCIQAMTPTSCGMLDENLTRHVCPDFACRQPTCTLVQYTDANFRVPVCNGNESIFINGSRVVVNTPLTNTNNLSRLNVCFNSISCGSFDNYTAYMQFYTTGSGRDKQGNYIQRAQDAGQCAAGRGNVNWANMHPDSFGIYTFIVPPPDNLSLVPPTLCTGASCTCNFYGVCDETCRQNNVSCGNDSEECVFTGDMLERSQAPCCNAQLATPPPVGIPDRYGCCDGVTTCWNGTTCVGNGSLNSYEDVLGNEWQCVENLTSTNLVSNPSFVGVTGWSFTGGNQCTFASASRTSEGRAAVCDHKYNGLTTLITMPAPSGVALSFFARNTEDRQIDVGLFVNTESNPRHVFYVQPNSSQTDWQMLSTSFFMQSSFNLSLKIMNCMDADGANCEEIMQFSGASIYFDDFTVFVGGTSWIPCNNETIGDRINGKQCYFYYLNGVQAYFWDEPGTHDLSYDWYHNDSAYCLGQNACFINRSVQCQQNQTFIGDHYCMGSNWTTRTALIARQLLNETTGDYTLFCDSAGATLNTFAGSYAHPFCVLNFSEGTYAGTALESNVSTFLTTVLTEIPAGQTTFDISMCDAVTGTDYQACDNTVAFRAFYNRETNSIIFTKNPSYTHAFASTWYDAVWDFLRRLFGVSTGGSLPAFVTHTSDLQKLYLARHGDKTIAAVFERKYDPAAARIKEYVMANFTNFSTSMTAVVDMIAADYEHVDGTVIVVADDDIPETWWQFITGSVRIKE